MGTSSFQELKIALVEATGLCKDTLHVYVGLAVLLIVAVVTRRRIGSLWPLIAVLVVALIGESIDIYDDLNTVGSARWFHSFRDMSNTLFWPLVLTVLAQTSLFSRRNR